MGDQDWLVRDPLSLEQSSDLYHLQLYSLERYIWFIIISEQTWYGPIEISVDFIKNRPTTILELVFKDEAGVEHKSNKFKEDDLVYWNLDLFVYFKFEVSKTDLFISVTLDPTPVLRWQSSIHFSK